MLAFWERGFDAVSIADLTAALKIGPPSLYAAFGDKKTLFHEAVERYADTHGSFADRAMSEEPTARRAVGRLLIEAAANYTDPRHPHGCLIISGAINCTPESADIEEFLRERRNNNVAALERRIRKDVRAGELPPGTSARGLAVFVGATLQGMSQQARDGASRADLLAVAKAAMRAWPA